MSTLFQRLLEDPTLVRLSVLEAVTWRNLCLRQFDSIHLEVASSRHKGLYLEDAVREACPSGDTCRVNNCIALSNGDTILKEELEAPPRGDSLKNYSTATPGNFLQQSQKETEAPA